MRTLDGGVPPCATLLDPTPWVPPLCTLVGSLHRVKRKRRMRDVGVRKRETEREREEEG
jgi:hypothetical protein